jgi:hypothetical protein
VQPATTDGEETPNQWYSRWGNVFKDISDSAVKRLSTRALFSGAKNSPPPFQAANVPAATVNPTSPTQQQQPIADSPTVSSSVYLLAPSETPSPAPPLTPIEVPQGAPTSISNGVRGQLTPTAADSLTVVRNGSEQPPVPKNVQVPAAVVSPYVGAAAPRSEMQPPPTESPSVASSESPSSIRPTQLEDGDSPEIVAKITKYDPRVPLKPIMGALVWVDNKYQVPAMGNVPNYEWSGLDDPEEAYEALDQTERLRQTSSKNNDKITGRTEGLSTKISEKSSLTEVQSKVLEHLKTHGLLTVAHVRHPRKQQMVNIVKQYGAFVDAQEVEESMEHQLSKYDRYDKSNDRSATKFLKNSLSANFALRLRSYFDAEEPLPFPVLYFKVMDMVCHLSEDQIQMHVELLKKITPHECKGQDMVEFVLKVRQVVDILVNAESYEAHYTQFILDAAKLAGGDKVKGNQGEEEYHDALMDFQRPYKKALRRVRVMATHAEKAKHMADNKLTAYDLLDVIQNTYVELKQLGRWEPAKTLKDKGALPMGYGHTLRHRDAPSSKSKDVLTCYLCGEPGHISTTCPNRSSESLTNSGSMAQSRKKLNQKQGRGRAKSPAPGKGTQSSPSSKPPRWEPGMLERQIGEDGTVWFNCKKCKRWTKSHGTADHGKKSTKQVTFAEEKQVLGQANLVFDTAEWTATHSPHAKVLTMTSPPVALSLSQSRLAQRQLRDEPALPIRRLATHLNTKPHATQQQSKAPLPTTVGNVIRFILLAMIAGCVLLDEQHRRAEMARVTALLVPALQAARQSLMVLFWQLLELAKLSVLLFWETYLQTAAGVLFMTLWALILMANVRPKWLCPDPLPLPPMPPLTRRQKRARFFSAQREKAFLKRMTIREGATAYGFHKKFPLKLRTKNAHQSLPPVPDAYGRAVLLWILAAIEAQLTTARIRISGPDGAPCREGVTGAGIQSKSRPQDPPGRTEGRPETVQFYNKPFDRVPPKPHESLKEGRSAVAWKDYAWERRQRRKKPSSSSFAEPLPRRKKTTRVLPIATIQRLFPETNTSQSTVLRFDPAPYLDSKKEPTAKELELIVQHGEGLITELSPEDRAKVPAWIPTALKACKKFAPPQDGPKDQHFKVIWDSGASMSVSPSASDFLGPIEPAPESGYLSGLFSGQKIGGIGIIGWQFLDTKGMLRMIKVPGYYLPGASARLLSTTSLLQQYPDEFLQQATTKGLQLSGTVGKTRPDGSAPYNGIQAPIDPETNLPTAFAWKLRSKPTRQAFPAVDRGGGPNGGPDEGPDSGSNGGSSGRSHGGSRASGAGGPGPRGNGDARDGSPGRVGGPAPGLDGYGRAGTPSNADSAAEDGDPPMPPLSTISRANANLTEAEKELLRWHFRLGHINTKRVKALMRSGSLGSSEAARRLQASSVRLRHHVMCTSCQYAKQRQRSTPSQTVRPVRDQVDALRRDTVVPGQRISVDHFICNTKGRRENTRGREVDSSKYVGGCIFVDHSTSFVHVELQPHLNTTETLQAKESFELLCRDFGVVPQEYLSDNGTPFTSQAYSRHLSTFEQITRFAGVGGHHQNGIAERSIQTIMSTARAMMIHSSLHWTDLEMTQLWPMAVKHAVYLWNRMPDEKTGLSPLDMFTKTRWPHSRFNDLHVWGCPVYVLDTTLSNGHKIPRWQNRSTRCIFVGMSDSHASSVPLVLNPVTGAITAQYHVVFDDWFATVVSDPSTFPAFFTPAWQKLFGDSAYQYIPTDDNEDADDIEYDLDGSILQREGRVRAAAEAHRPIEPLPLPPLPETEPPPLHVRVRPEPGLPREPSTLPREESELARVPVPQSQDPPRESGPESERSFEPSIEGPNESNSEYTLVRRSQRTRRPSRRIMTSAAYSALSPGVPSAFVLAQDAHFAYMYSFFRINAPSVYKAAASDPDTLSYDQAMADAPFVDEWKMAAMKEIQTLTEKGTWVEVDISEVKGDLLPGIWVFRRKRNLADGAIKKYKARYCVRGDMQTDIPETFAPVINWSSTRLLLVIALSLNWHTSSIDFTSAFVQATLDKPVWIRLPRGFKSTKGPNTCLRLKKSLYGLSEAPRLWFQHLTKALLSLGLKQSEFDSCLFYGKDILVGFHVDDAILVAKTPTAIDKLIEDLESIGFELTKEESLCDYLGIKMARDDKKGTITLTQQSLIEKIIKATGLEGCNPNSVPATQLALGSDPDGVPMQEKWSYSSVVGMLLYLATNSRPDIAFAVSQVARFSSAPKQSHATAVKTIVRYLSGTRDKGTIVKPNKSLTLDLYVDADFAGLYKREPDTSPDSVRSRTGYLILLGGCPLVWKSQLQTEISLSTLEAEYSALSYALKTLIPLKRLVIETSKVIGSPPGWETTVRARTFEDNQGCYCLATSHRLTNRTKYFLVKYHWFWSKAEEFVLYKVASEDQLADYLTKGLAKELFVKLRQKIQGW